MERRTLSQELTPGLKQAHRLVMSPRMQQALAVLQMPIMELATRVRAELERNPLLATDGPEEETDLQMEALLNEVEPTLSGQSSTEPILASSETPVEHSLYFSDEDFAIFQQMDDEIRDLFLEGASKWRQDWTYAQTHRGFNEDIVKEPTLFESLLRQAQETFDDAEERQMAEVIIGNLDDNGFLTTPLSEIAAWGSWDVDDLKPILSSIQTFSPPGVGAADVREALLIQLQQISKWESLGYRIVDQCYDELVHGQIAQVAKKLKVSNRDVQKAIRNDLSKLTLYPGHLHARDLTQTIVPDIIFTEEGERLRIEINSDDLPDLRLERRYVDMLENPFLAKEVRSYLQRRLAGAKWLIHNVDRRSRTLERIAVVLLHLQEPYLRSIEGKLKPMTMRQVAQEIGVNESTVARAVAGKYISCPRGVVSIRSLFSGAYETDEGKQVSRSAVRDTLERIIDTEDKQHPFTDEQLTQELQARGVTCARRTVANYRRELGYPSAAKRRQY